MMLGAGLARLHSLYDTISLRDDSLSPQGASPGLGPLPHLVLRRKVRAGLRVSETPLDLFTGKPRKCDLDQANRITLTAAWHYNNSLGDDFAHYLRLARVVKCLAGTVKSFAPSLKRLGVKHRPRYEGMDGQRLCRRRRQCVRACRRAGKLRRSPHILPRWGELRAPSGTSERGILHHHNHDCAVGFHGVAIAGAHS
jgi:hypothetical protein